jgi:exodeoxyribonuclease-5
MTNATIKPTSEQQIFLDTSTTWLSHQTSPSYYLTGFAGTGKTWVTQLQIGRLVANGQRVTLVAPTGKAASILKSKTGLPAKTLHSLLYTPDDKEARQVAKELEAAEQAEDWEKVEVLRAKWKSIPKVKWIRKDRIPDTDLIVVDECSMVDAPMYHLLMSHDIPVLFLGDQGQLPPVATAKSPLCAMDADCKLIEIVRHDNGIIASATAARMNMGIIFNDDVTPISREDVKLTLCDYDMRLCWTNKMRVNINREVRKQKGFNALLPQKGETILIRKNIHDDGLMNGETYTVNADAQRGTKDNFVVEILKDGNPVSILANEHFLKRDEFIGDGGKEADYPQRIIPGNYITFGYALTVHNAQGSEAPHILLIDEGCPYDREKWLYTAITRTQKKLQVWQTHGATL